MLYNIYYHLIFNLQYLFLKAEFGFVLSIDVEMEI